jgi:predicted nucleic acid-binding protein
MTVWVVADSGIFLAMALKETYSNQAVSLVSFWAEQDIKVAAPTLFRYEIIAVIRKSVFRNLISSQEAAQRQSSLLASTQGVTFMIDDNLLKRSYELATQLNRPTAYDSQYLAVAERLGCEFWTADQKLFNAVTGTLSWVKWIGNYTIPTITS